MPLDDSQCILFICALSRGAGQTTSSFTKWLWEWHGVSGLRRSKRKAFRIFYTWAAGWRAWGVSESAFVFGVVKRLPMNISLSDPFRGEEKKKKKKKTLGLTAGQEGKLQVAAQVARLFACCCFFCVRPRSRFFTRLRSRELRKEEESQLDLLLSW